MKSFGTYAPPETVGLNFKRFSIPHGSELPRAPEQGEMFFLNKEIDGQGIRTSFMRGMYISPGFGWEMFSSQFSKRKASGIGSQCIDVEIGCSLKRVPTSTEGFGIAHVQIKPEHRLTSISGTASFWVSHASDAYVSCSVFRENVLVGLSVQYVFAEKPTSMSISFLDMPGDNNDHVYTLRVNTTETGFLYVNQCELYNFDGASGTALIVSENN